MEFHKLLHRIDHGRHHHTREQIRDLSARYPKLTRLEDAKDKLLHYTKENQKRETQGRNFRVECFEENDGIHIVISGIRSSLRHDFHTELLRGWRIINCGRWGCNNGEQVIGVSLAQRETVAFFPTLLHEYGHQHQKCPRSDPAFTEAMYGFVSGKSHGPEDERALLQTIGTITEGFQPEASNRAGRYQKEAILGYVAGEGIEAAMDLDERSRSVGERDAWMHAFRRIGELERQGFDFNFPHAEMRAHAYACLARYSLSVMQNVILEQECEDLSGYKPYYVCRKRMRDVLNLVGFEDHIVFGS